VKTKTYQFTTLKVASIAIMAAIGVFSFAVLGGPVPEKQTDAGSVSAPGPVSITMSEEKPLQQARCATPLAATQLGSIVGVCSMLVTGLAVAALVIPFGLCSISLLRRTSSLESGRVRCLAEPVSGHKQEQEDPGVAKPFLAGVE
jgi:hypothetical protein